MAFATATVCRDLEFQISNVHFQVNSVTIAPTTQAIHNITGYVLRKLSACRDAVIMA